MKITQAVVRLFYFKHGAVRKMKSFTSAIAILILLGVTVGGVAESATFVVDEPNSVYPDFDTTDGECTICVAGGGTCETATRACSLMAALQQARALPGEHTIRFAVPNVFNYQNEADYFLKPLNVIGWVQGTDPPERVAINANGRHDAFGYRTLHGATITGMNLRGLEVGSFNKIIDNE